MGSVLLALAVLAPLALLALFLAARNDGPRWTLPLASLPAAALALVADAGLEQPLLLLELRLRLDGPARAILLLTGIAWSAAAWFAATRLAERFRTFALFWLAALAGLVLAALAADVATFYTGYAALTLAAYGLVAHERTPAALHAARVYLVLALLGEALLLSGVLLVASRLGNADLAVVPLALEGADAAWAAALLLGGFGVKMGLVPLHPWLPVAHPVAPVAASAILSGVVVKAGLLGTLRLVPASPFDGAAAEALAAVGIFTAFYGVAAGLCQGKLKVVLAYSTVSQMGLVAVALAASLGTDGQRGGPLVALLVLHHGLNKAALFVAAGSGAGASPLRRLLLALPALSLIGLPLTSGALAKQALKEALAHGQVATVALALLGAASVATALLMLRAWVLARQERGAAPPVHPAWPALVVAGIAVPWWYVAGTTGAAWPDVKALLDGLWPLALALAAAAVWQRLRRPLPALPPGDILPALEAATAAALRGARWWQKAVRWPPRLPLRRLRVPLERAVRRIEAALAGLPGAGVALLALTGLAWWALG